MFAFDPYSPVVDADPFPFYKTLRDEYPCFWSREANMWVLSRYADIMAALGNWQTYSSARGNLMDELPNRAGATLGTTDPPRHDRLRALIQHAFTKRNLETLAEPIRTLVRTLIDALRDRAQFDFVGDFSSKVCRVFNAKSETSLSSASRISSTVSRAKTRSISSLCCSTSPRCFGEA